jgi:Osmosensitive K+ channel His kinase sensor domain
MSVVRREAGQLDDPKGTDRSSKPYRSPSATCHTVEGTARMDNGRLVIWNPLYRTEPAGPGEGRSVYREAAEITEQMSVTGSEGTGQGVSQAAEADTEASGEVEAAGHFRIYLGAAPGVGKTYAMLCEAQRRRGRGADVVAGFVEAYGPVRVTWCSRLTRSMWTREL